MSAILAYLTGGGGAITSAYWKFFNIISDQMLDRQAKLALRLLARLIDRTPIALLSDRDLLGIGIFGLLYIHEERFPYACHEPPNDESDRVYRRSHGGRTTADGVLGHCELAGILNVIADCIFGSRIEGSVMMKFAQLCYLKLSQCQCCS